MLFVFVAAAAKSRLVFSLKEDYKVSLVPSAENPALENSFCPGYLLSDVPV